MDRPDCWRVEEGYPPCPDEWPGQTGHWCPACRQAYDLDGPDPGWDDPQWYKPLPYALVDPPVGPVPVWYSPDELPAFSFEQVTARSKN